MTPSRPCSAPGNAALEHPRAGADEPGRDGHHVHGGHADLGAEGVVGAVLEAPDRRLPIGHVVAIAAGVQLVAQAGRVAEVEEVLLADAVLSGPVVEAVAVLDEEARTLAQLVLGLDPEGDVMQPPRNGRLGSMMKPKSWDFSLLVATPKNQGDPGSPSTAAMRRKSSASRCQYIAALTSGVVTVMWSSSRTRMPCEPVRCGRSG